MNLRSTTPSCVNKPKMLNCFQTNLGTASRKLPPYLATKLYLWQKWHTGATTSLNPGSNLSNSRYNRFGDWKNSMWYVTKCKHSSHLYSVNLPSDYWNMCYEEVLWNEKGEKKHFTLISLKRKGWQFKGHVVLCDHDIFIPLWSAHKFLGSYTAVSIFCFSQFIITKTTPIVSIDLPVHLNYKLVYIWQQSRFFPIHFKKCNDDISFLLQKRSAASGHCSITSALSWQVFSPLRNTNQSYYISF